MDFLLHFGPSHYNDLFRCDEPYFSHRGKGSAKDFVQAYMDNCSKTSNKGLICIPSGNHDMDRLSRRLDTDEMKLAFAFLMSMPGAPFLYYGDVIGMRYIEGLSSKEGGYGRTGSRTPMQWNSERNAGFSDAKEDLLYLPIDPDSDRPTVEHSLCDDNSLLNEVKRLIKLRKAHLALGNFGQIEFISNEYPIIYKRSFDNEEILVIINPADRIFEIPLKSYKDILYFVGSKPRLFNGSIEIQPVSALFIKLQ